MCSSSQVMSTFPFDLWIMRQSFIMWLVSSGSLPQSLHFISSYRYWQFLLMLYISVRNLKTVRASSGLKKWRYFCGLSSVYSGNVFPFDSVVFSVCSSCNVDLMTIFFDQLFPRFCHLRNFFLRLCDVVSCLYLLALLRYTSSFQMQIVFAVRISFEPGHPGQVSNIIWCKKHI